MTEFSIRAACHDDADALSLIAGASFLETFVGILDGADIVDHWRRRSSATAFMAWIADPRSRVALAEHPQGSAPIGYTVLTAPDDLPIEPLAGDIELRRIYALAQMHGGGLGAALMARAIEDARALGRRRMLLGVYGGNARAQRFYVKQGFAVIGTRRFLVGATWHDDLVFARSV